MQQGIIMLLLMAGVAGASGWELPKTQTITQIIINIPSWVIWLFAVAVLINIIKTLSGPWAWIKNKYKEETK